MGEPSEPSFRLEPQKSAFYIHKERDGLSEGWHALRGIPRRRLEGTFAGRRADDVNQVESSLVPREIGLSRRMYIEN